MKKRILLEDPTSFAVYDLKIKGVRRRIVLLGEVHEITRCAHNNAGNSKVMPVAEFIKQYHNSIGPDRILDIFSESFYIGNKKLGWLPTLHYLVYISSHLDDARALSYIRKRLDACSPKYNFSIYECPEKLRVHLCDVRFVKDMEYHPSKDRTHQDCMVDMLFKVGLSYINIDKIPRVKYAISGLLSFVRKFLFDKSSPEYHVKLAEYIREETKVQKQIAHIDSAVVRNKLIKWSRQNYDKNITNARSKLLQFEKQFRIDADGLSDIEYVSEKCVNTFHSEVSLPILYVISVFMDSYLCARLLRRFSDSSYAENSIVYVGEFHAKQYRELFLSLGAKEVFFRSSIKDIGYVSCVDISKFYYSDVSPKRKIKK